MTDFRQNLSPLDSLNQQAQRLRSQTSQVFDGLTSELVGAGNALMNSASQAASAVTGFISGADAAFSNFITRITPNELLTKRSGISSLIPAGKIINLNKSSLIGSDSLQFPLNPSDAKYKMRLSFREYVRPSALSAPKIERKNAIILPISADGMREGSRIGWDVQATGLTGAIVNSFGGENFEKSQTNLKNALSTGDFNATVNSLEERMNKQNENSKDNAKVAAAQIAKRYLAQKLGGGLFDLGTQILGEIPNPHPTVLFRGIGLKDYQFSFRFAPTSEQESKMLRKIINKLKEYSLPKYVNNTDKNMFKYPMMVYPEFVVDGGQSVGKNGGKGELAKVYPFGFKYCVITGITVNYAPVGTPVFFAKGQGETAFIDMNLSLQEIEVQTSEDYSDGESSGGVGAASEGSPDETKTGASDVSGSEGGGITSSELPPPSSETASADTTESLTAETDNIIQRYNAASPEEKETLKPQVEDLKTRLRSHLGVINNQISSRQKIADAFTSQ